jgi:hypothetical protein
MIKRIFLLALLLAPALAWAETRSIHVTWEYAPPEEPEVTGYQLYQDGVKLANCYWAGAETAAGDCTVTVAPDTKAVFTLSAPFADETESPHSSPYYWAHYVTIKLGKFAPKGGRRGWVGLQ